MNSMFLVLDTIYLTGYADDFVIRDHIANVMSAFQEVDEKVLILFSAHQMKQNPNKYYLLLKVQERKCTQN